MKLYWVTTEDHDEDWFVVASSAEEAAEFHEKEEGYAPGDAEAEKVLAIPDDVTVDAGYPPNDFLKSIGGEFLSDESTRVVKIAGRTFCEGMLASLINEVVDDEFEKRGRGRVNKTRKPFYQS